MNVSASFISASTNVTCKSAEPTEGGNVGVPILAAATDNTLLKANSSAASWATNTIEVGSIIKLLFVSWSFPAPAVTWSAAAVPPLEFSKSLLVKVNTVSPVNDATSPLVIVIVFPTWNPCTAVAFVGVILVISVIIFAFPKLTVALPPEAPLYPEIEFIEAGVKVITDDVV